MHTTVPIQSFVFHGKFDEEDSYSWECNIDYHMADMVIQVINELIHVHHCAPSPRAIGVSAGSHKLMAVLSRMANNHPAFTFSLVTFIGGAWHPDSFPNAKDTMLGDKTLVIVQHHEGDTLSKWAPVKEYWRTLAMAAQGAVHINVLTGKLFHIYGGSLHSVCPMLFRDPQFWDILSDAPEIQHRNTFEKWSRENFLGSSHLKLNDWNPYLSSKILTWGLSGFSWLWNWFICTAVKYALLYPKVKRDFPAIDSATKFAASVIAASQTPLLQTEAALSELSHKHRGKAFVHTICAPLLAELANHATEEKEPPRNTSASDKCDSDTPKQYDLALAFFDPSQRLSFELKCVVGPMAEIVLHMDSTVHSGEYFFDWYWYRCADHRFEMPRGPHARQAWTQTSPSDTVPGRNEVVPPNSRDSWQIHKTSTALKQRGLKTNDLLLLFDDTRQAIPVIVQEVNYRKGMSNGKKVHERWRIKSLGVAVLKTDLPQEYFSLTMAVGLFLGNQCHVHHYEKAFKSSPGFCDLVLGVSDNVVPLQPENKMADWASNYKSSQDESTHKTHRTLVAQKLKAPCTVIQSPPGTGKTSGIMSVIDDVATHCETQPGTFRCLVLANSNQAVTHSALSLISALRNWSDECPESVLLIRAQHREPFVEGRSLTLGPTDQAALLEALTGNTVQFYFMTLGLCLKEEVPLWVNSSSLMYKRFDLVLVEEAGTTLVPDILPLPIFLKPHGNIILAGDHKQLPGHNATAVHTLSAMNACMRKDNVIHFLHQYRMTQGLSQIISSFFYEGSMECARRDAPCFKCSLILVAVHTDADRAEVVETRSGGTGRPVYGSRREANIVRAIWTGMQLEYVRTYIPAYARTYVCTCVRGRQ